MFNALRYLRPVLAATVLFTTPACAAGVYYPQRSGVGDRDDRVFYNRGFNEGRAIGIEDARRGREFDVRTHREWRDIDRQRIERDDAVAYRRGFESGYEQGYRQFARQESPRAYPPSSRNGDRDRSDRDRSDRDRNGDRDRSTSAAGQIGYRDGLEDGQHDARQGERFDPVRSRRYRSADHDYDRRYGSLDAFKREYRDAFQRGYEEGYRAYRR